jgi:hypothetical protein
MTARLIQASLKPAVSGTVEAALVLFSGELACEEGQEKLLLLLLLGKVVRLSLMDQQHGECKGVAHLSLPPATADGGWRMAPVWRKTRGTYMRWRTLRPAMSASGQTGRHGGIIESH